MRVTPSHLESDPLRNTPRPVRQSLNKVPGPGKAKSQHLAAGPAPVTTPAAERRTRSRGIEPRGAADQREPLVLTKHLWPGARGAQARGPHAGLLRP